MVSAHHGRTGLPTGDGRGLRATYTDRRIGRLAEKLSDDVILATPGKMGAVWLKFRSSFLSAKYTMANLGTKVHVQ